MANINLHKVSLKNVAFNKIPETQLENSYLDKDFKAKRIIIKGLAVLSFQFVTNFLFTERIKSAQSLVQGSGLRKNLSVIESRTFKKISSIKISFFLKVNASLS